MNGEVIRVLLVEDDPDDSLLIREMLNEAKAARFVAETRDLLSAGLDYLAQQGADIVLLDLSLPDTHGLATLASVRTLAPDVPVVILTGFDDETLAVQAVSEGAQDYLVKGQMDSPLLVRAIRYALERHRLLRELRAASLVDVLTGLYNRRGFFTLGEQQLKFARRTQRGLMLIYLDLDGFKEVNDKFGHAAGDLALAQVAALLRRTMRDSDLIARLGGDEFVILALEASDDSGEALTARLNAGLDDVNAQAEHPYALTFSVGTAWFDPGSALSLEALIAKADAAMYDHKRHKRKRPA